MVSDRGPGVTLGLGFFEDICQAIKGRFAIFVVLEDLSTFNPTGHYMLEEAEGV